MLCFNSKYRFHGSYQKSCNGSTSDAFVILTGGMAETVDSSKVKDEELHSRLTNALTSGGVVAALVPVSITLI